MEKFIIKILTKITIKHNGAEMRSEIKLHHH